MTGQYVVLVRYVGMANCCIVYCLTDPTHYVIVMCPTCKQQLTHRDGAWERVSQSTK